MKKIYIILFSLFIFLININNANALILKPSGSEEGKVGGELTFYITLDDNHDNISAIDGTFNYDSNIFTLVSSSCLVNNWSELSNISNNKVFGYANLSFDNMISDLNKDIVKVILKVNEKVKAGNYSISIDNPNATNEEGNSISIEGGSHIVKILSNMNSLSSLILSTGTIEFNEDVIYYNLTVDNEIDNIEISAELSSTSSSFVEGYKPRKVNLSVGNNIIEIKVKAEDGEIRTYTLNITRQEKIIDDDIEKPNDNKPGDNDDTNDDDNKPNDDIEKPDDNKPDEDDSSNNEEPNDSTGSDKDQTDDSNKPSVEQEKKSSNNYLNKLIPSHGSIVFDKAKCEYFITVPYETDNINFELMVEDKKASANIEGNNNLKVGENIITITVTAEDGNKREYKIIVTRKDENIVLSSNSKLKKLMVKGYNLEFDSDKYEYNLKIHNEDFLDITYITQDEKSDVTIVGNNNLKDKSVITVTVVAEDGSTTSYIINIEKTILMNIILLIIIFIVIVVIVILTVYLIYQRKKLKSI